MQQRVLYAPLFLGVMFFASVDAVVDCSKLPNAIEPLACCDYPQVFKDNALTHCKNSSAKGNQCFYDCVFTITEICRKKECSYNKAEDYVAWVMPAENPFAAIYKNAFKKCIAKANDIRSNAAQRLEQSSCDPLPEMIYLCVESEMFTSCPRDQWVNDVADCTNKREFIENCIKDD